MFTSRKSSLAVLVYISVISLSLSSIQIIYIFYFLFSRGSKPNSHVFWLCAFTIHHPLVIRIMCIETVLISSVNCRLLANEKTESEYNVQYMLQVSCLTRLYVLGRRPHNFCPRFFKKYNLNLLVPFLFTSCLFRGAFWLSLKIFRHKYHVAYHFKRKRKA